MTPPLRAALVALAFALCVPLQPAHALTASLERIKTPRGASQAFILIKPPQPPVASVILFAGGRGALNLVSANEMKWGAGNFLVRTRNKFANRGLMVAVIDAPSDQLDGMEDPFRLSKAHADDIAAVTARLKAEASVPVWLVGTSRGTLSTANGGIAAKGIDGIVLTSTLTRTHSKWEIAKSHPEAVVSLPLSRITVPTLIAAHKKDDCDYTPASGASKLKAKLTKSPRVEVLILEGGNPPESEPCEAKSPHGFLGIEDKAIDAIVAFIKAGR